MIRDIKIDLSHMSRHTIDTSQIKTQAEGERAALLIAEKLVDVNSKHLPPTKLYDSGVKYRAEATDAAYADATACIARGYADAVEIAAWRCAELRAAGVNARIYLERQAAGDAPHIFYYTVKVLLPDGSTENTVEQIRECGAR